MVSLSRLAVSVTRCLAELGSHLPQRPGVRALSLMITFHMDAPRSLRKTFWVTEDPSQGRTGGTMISFPTQIL